ncbi:MAG: hypothetical protein FGM32_04755 [Candidatus Kapabacteria bacterium]|nr:hypothetical protein [Candidatus Kapabacteria bacterium]
MKSSQPSRMQQPHRTWQNPWALGSILFVVLLTLVCYQPIFDESKQFVNWDDDYYITEQPLVESVSKKSIREMFDTKTTVSANYHPLTMLSLAIDVERGGMTMKSFMQTNLALHTVNAVLVFVLMMMMFNGSVPLAFTAALLFAVHPMHVESVAWAAARKDVLYTLFYLLACIAYVRYTRTSAWLTYGATVLLFLLSCLSKPMALTLPVLLLAIDMYVGRFRQGWVRPVVEKLPLMAISIAFGLMVLSIQSSASVGLVDTTTYSLANRLVFAGYGVVQYLYKLILPVHLSAFYPYPNDLRPGNTPFFMIAGAVLMVLTVVGFVVAWRRSRGTVWNTIVFGLAFYFITASLVLQVISVGGASMADRYTYVPYIGFFIVIGLGVQHLASRMRSPLIALSAIGVIGIAMAWLSNDRIGVWKNSEILWTDVIEQYPYEFRSTDGGDIVVKKGVLYAYSNRGIHYIKTQQYERGAADLAVLSRARVNHADSYRAYGVALQYLSRHAEAIDAFTTTMNQGQTDYQVYRARGISYFQVGQLQRALEDLTVSVEKKPDEPITQQALAEIKGLIAAQQGTPKAP